MIAGTPAQRLSFRANAVLTLAYELGRREPGIEPNSGHVLIALAREGGSVVEDTLNALGVRYEDVLTAVATAGSVPDAKLELTDMLNVAGRIARDRGQSYVDAAHLLAASIDNPESVAARAFATRGITREQVERHLWADRDMLVPLLTLPDPGRAIARVQQAGVQIRRARAWESPAVQAFIVDQAFTATWSAETANGFARRPISVFVAERGGAIVGFAAYDCGPRGVAGPIGVARNERASGIAGALLLRALSGMRGIGYVYAIIGAVGPAEFFERVCGAVLLPSAWPSYVEWEDT
ncbi:MAG: Clp protease N-terminal domain-containing protein [Dehalococcoidia bacterium]